MSVHHWIYSIVVADVGRSEQERWARLLMLTTQAVLVVAAASRFPIRFDLGWDYFDSFEVDYLERGVGVEVDDRVLVG